VNTLSGIIRRGEGENESILKLLLRKTSIGGGENEHTPGSYIFRTGGSGTLTHPPKDSPYVKRIGLSQKIRGRERKRKISGSFSRGKGDTVEST